MPIEISMPKLSDTMTDGTLVKWLKKEGDKIKPGDIIAEVETDKATQELEAFEAGIIAKQVVAEGAKVPVGGVIVVVAKDGEDAKSIGANYKASAAPVAKAEPESKSAESKPAAPAPEETAPPEHRVAAATPNVPDAPSAGALPKAEFDEGYEQTAAGGHGKMRISPLARRLAEEKGVDLSRVRGTGPDGRIVKRDILEAAANPPAVAPVASSPRSAAPALAPKAPLAKLENKTIPLSSMRQTIARRLVQSKQTIPHFYVSIDVQMDKLLDLRKQANEQLAPEKTSVTDFVIKAVAVAITRIPAINASFTDAAIIQHGSVDLGIAVSIDDGLVVPVLRQAHAKSVRQISGELKNLADLARSKKLKAQDMTGSTFTISNMGMFGIKDFQAIVNPPESAILAVGGTEWRPIVKEVGGKKEIVPAQVMTLTLSVDHRVVDGAVGARFLTELKNIIENPLSLVM